MIIIIMMIIIIITTIMIIMIIMRSLNAPSQFSPRCVQQTIKQKDAPQHTQISH